MPHADMAGFSQVDVEQRRSRGSPHTGAVLPALQAPASRGRDRAIAAAFF
jgi:hypothetical protein